MKSTKSSDFMDTFCHQPDATKHFEDIDCHYKLMVQQTSTNNTCSVEVPYPVGKTFTTSIATPPVMFHLDNYTERLKNTKCNAVYRQYTVLAIHEAFASGIPMKPMYTIAPMKTSIQFFNETSPTVVPIIKKNDGHNPLELNKSNTFSITKLQLEKTIDKALPTYFNWMNNEEITRPVDQGLCGSCWAVAASTCLSDVYVVSQHIKNPQLSTDYILSCLPQHQCEGGNPFKAVHDMENNGARPSTCIKPSGASKSSEIAPCKCAHEAATYFPTDTQTICIPPDLNSLPPDQANVFQSYLQGLYGTIDTVNLSSVPYTDIQKIIKTHIYEYGPVVTGFHVFKNFMKGDYRETNDIYIETESYQGIAGIKYDDLAEDWIGSHAVVIVGWGKGIVRGINVPYWIVRNSWGEKWGLENGTFKIAMYGKDTFSNRISQFEYPSLVTTDAGYGVTGGVILMKAGAILPPTREAKASLTNIPTQIKRRWILYTFLVVTSIVLYLMMCCLPRTTAIWIILGCFLIMGLLLTFTTYF